MNTELFNSADDRSTKHGVCLPAQTQSIPANHMFYLDVFKMSFLIGFIKQDLKTSFSQHENMFESRLSLRSQMNR